MNKLKILKNSPLFTGLTEDEISILSDLFQKRKYPSHCIIFCEGMEGRNLYIVEKGGVKITKLREKSGINVSEEELARQHKKAEPDLMERVLAVLKQGDFLGEMSFIDDKKGQQLQ
jgi:CRP-like cAMP-binding protein